MNHYALVVLASSVAAAYVVGRHRGIELGRYQAVRYFE